MYYFENKGEQEKLRGILESWIDTPFRHHCGVKGLGCDCIHFVVRIFEELDVIRNVIIPNYPKDWHLHNTRELLEEGILRYLKVKKVTLPNLINGDIILSHFGKAASHGGIYFDGYVYQALNGIGVRRINFSDRKFRARMKFAYRILK